MPLLLSLTTLSKLNNSITTGSSVTPTPTPTPTPSRTPTRTPTPSSSSSTITDSESDEISPTSSGLLEDEIVEEQIRAPPTFNSTMYQSTPRVNKFNRPEALTLQRVLDGVMIYFISLLIIVVFSVLMSCLWYLRNRKKTLPPTNDVELEETEDKNKKHK